MVLLNSSRSHPTPLMASSISKYLPHTLLSDGWCFLWCTEWWPIGSLLTDTVSHWASSGVGLVLTVACVSYGTFATVWSSNEFPLDWAINQWNEACITMCCPVVWICQQVACQAKESSIWHGLYSYLLIFLLLNCDLLGRCLFWPSGCSLYRFSERFPIWLN